MKRDWILALVLLGSSIMSANADLPQKLAEEQSDPSRLTWQALGSALAGYRVVFVGLDNFYFKPLDAFRDNMATLKSDIGFDNIALINSDFAASYDSNAETLATSFENQYSAGGQKPLIVVGNPQSGPDSLYAILHRPELLNEIAKVVLVQPAFGSPLADAAEGDVMARFFATSFFGNDLNKFETAPVRTLFTQAIAALSAENRAALTETAESKARVYFVQAAADSRQVDGTLLAGPFGLMNILYPGQPTDGISFTTSQKLEGVGCDLGQLDANHWDLFASAPAVTSPASLRAAFTRALLEEVLGL